MEKKLEEKRRKIKILYISNSYVVFVKKDIDILRKYFEVEFLKYRGFMSIICFIFTLLLKIRNIDVIFCRFASTHAFFAVLFSKIFRKKSIVVVGGFDIANIPEINYGFARSPLTRFLLRFTINNADRVLPLSEALKKDIFNNVGRVRGGNIEVVPNGYDTKKWKPAGKKERLVITVCGELNETICKRKGIEVFIQAARYLPDVEFVVIDKKTKYSRKLEENAPKNVKFVSVPTQSKELLRYYQKAKVYCQLSRYEGHPNALSEAMLCECVPVGTKYGGIPEVIGDTGFYVPYGDAKATAEAIKKALNSDKGKEARKRIETLFPLERRETALFNIVHKLLGGEHEKLS